MVVSRRKARRAPAPPKPKMGRPTLYREEYVEQARKLCNLGATDRELAEFFGVSIFTIWQWQVVHPEFSSAIKGSKEAYDDRVERRLCERAMGYSVETVKIFLDKDGSIVEAPYVEHYAPDATSMIFWLKNRRSGAWRDRREEQIEGEVTIKVKGGLPED